MSPEARLAGAACLVGIYVIANALWLRVARWMFGLLPEVAREDPEVRPYYEAWIAPRLDLRATLRRGVPFFLAYLAVAIALAAADIYFALSVAVAVLLATWAALQEVSSGIAGARQRAVRTGEMRRPARVRFDAYLRAFVSSFLLYTSLPLAAVLMGYAIVDLLR